MTTLYKVLGQSKPAAVVDATLYTVPAATVTVISTLTICNQASTVSTFCIAIRPAGAVLAAEHYLSYDVLIGGNDTIGLTFGITLAATDVVTVRSSTGTVSFIAFGAEMSG